MKSLNFLAFWLMPLIFTCHLFGDELTDLQKYTHELEQAFNAKIQMDESVTPTSIHKKLKINFDKINPITLEKIKGEVKEKLFDVLSANELTTKKELDNAITTSQEVLVQLKENNKDKEEPKPQSPSPTSPAPLPQEVLPPMSMPEPIPIQEPMPIPVETYPVPIPPEEIGPPPIPMEPMPINTMPEQMQPIPVTPPMPEAIISPDIIPQPPMPEPTPLPNLGMEP